MKIVVAPDSFKGSLSSKDIGDLFVDTARTLCPDAQVVAVQIADGGEGTLDAILATGRFVRQSMQVYGPLWQPVTAHYGINGDTALIEMAQASGLTLIEWHEDNALHTTTYGTGQLIAHAIEAGARHIIVSVGGSATNDGGIGALAAMGYRFLDAEDQDLEPVGANLEAICRIDGSQAIDTTGVRFTVMTDVDNPLVGATGATMFYGRQKGADAHALDVLEHGMQHYADVLQSTTHVDVRYTPGAGAAGGLSGGLMDVLGARICSGIDTVLDLIGFDALLDGADAVITGEGRIDDQSAHGKAISGVCHRAARAGVPVYAMVGCSAISPEGSAQLGLRAIYPLSQYASDVQDSIAHAPQYARRAATQILQHICQSGGAQ